MTTPHTTADRNRWLEQRLKLLAREKELSRLGDEVARERRALPWVRHHDRYEPEPFTLPTGACCGGR